MNFANDQIANDALRHRNSAHSCSLIASLRSSRGTVMISARLPE
jgi:hypothetical protein